MYVDVASVFAFVYAALVLTVCLGVLLGMKRSIILWPVWTVTVMLVLSFLAGFIQGIMERS